VRVWCTIPALSDTLLAVVNVVLRTLVATDAQAYQALRLDSLRECPEAFMSAFEEEQQTSLETIARRLEHSSNERYALGAFEREKLIGILSFRRWEGVEDPASGDYRGHVCSARITRQRRWKGTLARGH
jgi:hypothetical protein